VIWVGTGVDQLAPMIGTYGLGAVAMLLGGSFWLLGAGQKRHALAIVLPMGAYLLLSATQPKTPCAGCASGVPITVVQPNINQNAKYDPQLEADNFTRLARLTGPGTGEPRLIFWPEAAVPAYLDIEPLWRQRIARLMRPGDLLMLGGDKLHMRKGSASASGSVYDPADIVGANNSLWVLTPDARLTGRYDKAHLVPYGEYLPMRPLLSAIGLSRLVPGDIDFWPGPGPRTLALPPAKGRVPVRMAVQICYEIIFSGQVIDRDNRPDMLFNPSNDAWFGSWGPPQHLAQARLRAIEEAVPVIRATPTGISAIIAPDGDILASIPLGKAGAIHSVLPRAGEPTLFGRLGNIIPLVIGAIFLLTGVAFGRVRS